MKEYTYKFADGTKCTVEVSDELYKKLKRLDKDEYNDWQRENRRHVSLESCGTMVLTCQYMTSILLESCLLIYITTNYPM